MAPAVLHASPRAGLLSRRARSERLPGRADLSAARDLWQDPTQLRLLPRGLPEEPPYDRTTLDGCTSGTVSTAPRHTRAPGARESACSQALRSGVDRPLVRARGPAPTSPPTSGSRLRDLGGGDRVRRGRPPHRCPGRRRPARACPRSVLEPAVAPECQEELSAKRLLGRYRPEGLRRNTTVTASRSHALPATTHATAAVVRPSIAHSQSAPRSGERSPVRVLSPPALRKRCQQPKPNSHFLRKNSDSLAVKK